MQRFFRTTLSAAIGVALSASAHAGTVYLNVTPDVGSTPTPAGVQTRYKISNTNWDMMLGNAAAVTPADINARDLGNNPALSGKQYNYTVVNLVGKGLYFKLTPLTGGGNTAVNSWGGITAGDIGSYNVWTNQTTLNGVAPQTTPYNSLHVYAQASSTGDQVDFANVTFNINTPGNAFIGSLPTSGQAKFGVQPVTDSYLAYFNDDGSVGDLSNVNWAFSADVTVTRGAASASGESAKFELTGKTLSYSAPTAVPETTTWVMGFLALGAAVVLLRTRQKTA